MKIKLVLACMAIILSQSLAAQKKLPVIKANNVMVDIADDGQRRESAWEILPEEALDVYTTSAKKVTFYTDIDSISFKINPKVGTYDFIILLNGRDSARTRIQYQPSKLDMLKKAKAYNLADKRQIPQFGYQPADDPALVHLRETLKLDSIAGNASELSQIFNLMHWLHNLVAHDGTSDNPDSKNAIDLIQVCKDEGRGINCRMLATVLNECYLAMGIKSRYVTCMPRESEFEDCHVINMVYSTELDKWIWIDPTFAAYVMDEKGNLLGLGEVRERLVKEQPLILNADANWNHQQLMTKAYYLDYYMAKNLYRMQCPVYSQYNNETAAPGKSIEFVELLPLDGIEQEPQKSEWKSNSGMTHVYYITNNPGLFWVKP